MKICLYGAASPTIGTEYIEAVEDGIEDSTNALKIIKEQSIKLENKVRSLLYLNKLDYFKDVNGIELKSIDIEKIIFGKKIYILSLFNSRFNQNI